MADETTHADFFISYTGKDRAWAEWIAMQLEEASYRTIIQAWDFRPGSNFVAEMDDAAKRAERTLLVLSPAYLASDYAFAEWAAAFRHDPRGKQGRVLPVRIQRCEVEGLLGPIVYIDLVDLDELRALERLLAGVQPERAKPVTVPFPASVPSQVPVDRPVFPGSLPPVWNIPYPQNPLFIGHEDLLSQLVTTLHTGQPTALSQPQAISGLGGIGKTQLALEYAYRHRQDYQAVLWALADTREALTSSFLTIATLLDLPEKNESESARVIAAVKNWLHTSIGWLLILDNADDLAQARDFLPPSVSGHVLLTTRAQATGRFARRLEVETLPTELGALFLLRRAGLLASDALVETASPSDSAVAKEITEELGGLPLALDQAGAYIEETGCGLAYYQRLFQHRRANLLAERRGLINDHPLPVATTWFLSFQQIEGANAAAADFLRLCAFLAPDAIPEAIIIVGSQHLGPQLAPVGVDPYLLNQAIEALRAYSLVHREASSAGTLLSVHRLVQAVLKDQMDEQSRQQWAERTVCAVNAAFPDVKFTEWSFCEQLLPHALVCWDLINQYHLFSRETSALLKHMGWYLMERARYVEAEQVLRQAMTIQEQRLTHTPLDAATSFNDLAELYWRQGKYTEAEPLVQHALTIREQQLGPSHPDTAISLNDLAVLYRAQGKYEQAKPLHQRALAIREQQLGPVHPSTQIIRRNAVALLRTMGRDEEAKVLETKYMPPS